jgi:hypothetical protein
MTLKELKDFINNLPEEMNDFTVVNGEVGYFDIENTNDKDDDKVMYRVDKPIIALYVDKNDREICLFHQTQEDVNDVLNSNEYGDTTST